jgi:hypothetical protein
MVEGFDGARITPDAAAFTFEPRSPCIAPWEMVTMDIPRQQRHPELSLVSLALPVTAEGRVLPPGATGTVVHVYPDEQAYEVEFTSPFHTVATVEAASIKE